MIPAYGAQLTQARGALARGPAFLGYGLLLLALPTLGTSAVIGLILAYALRDGAPAVLRSHYRFQIRIFWTGLALGAAALVLAMTAVYEAARPVPAPVRVPVAADAKLVAWRPGEDAVEAQPADVQVFSYSFGSRPLVWRTRAALEGAAAAVLFGFACLWGLGAPLYGAARLASGRGMGHDPG